VCGSTKIVLQNLTHSVQAVFVRAIALGKFYFTCGFSFIGKTRVVPRTWQSVAGRGDNLWLIRVQATHERQHTCICSHSARFVKYRE